VRTSSVCINSMLSISSSSSSSRTFIDQGVGKSEYKLSK
jgi:hypothetical protein